jgi:hypothetical protein
MLRWIPVTESLPQRPGVGLVSDPVFTSVSSFGLPTATVIAVYWEELEGVPKCYLDPITYNLDTFIEIAQEVTHWIEIPKLDKEKND